MIGNPGRMDDLAGLDVVDERIGYCLIQQIRFVPINAVDGGYRT
jgi:hypothetical protein